MNNPLAGTDPSGYVSVGNLGVTGETAFCGYICSVKGTVLKGFTSSADNGKRGQSKEALEREVVALGGQKALADYYWLLNYKSSRNEPVSGGTADTADLSDSGDRYDIDEHQLREMMLQPDLYGGALANVASTLQDEELDDILGDQAELYRKELEDAFYDGWGKAELANAPITLGFAPARAVLMMSSLAGAIGNTRVAQAARNVSVNANTHIPKYSVKQRDACLGIFMAVCGPSGVIDDTLKYRGPYAPKPVGPSKYEPAGSLVLDPRRHLDGIRWLRKNEQIR